MVARWEDPGDVMTVTKCVLALEMVIGDGWLTTLWTSTVCGPLATD